MPKLKLQQPQGFYVIAFGELCERFSYYGAQTLLVLCLTKVFLLNDGLSFSLYGAYATFAYALPVLGGLLADRLLGLKQTIIIGGLLLIIGNLFMAAQQLNSFYIGLALTACGTGLYKPNSTSLIGKLYSGEDAKRDSGFTLFYMGMNIGATLSPFIYGFTKQWGYQHGYLISAFLLLVSWLLFLIKNYRNKLIIQQIQINSQKQCLAYLLIFVVVGLVGLLFLYPMLLNNFLLVFAVAALAILFLTAFKREKTERNRLLGLLILGLFGMCFFAASLQVGSSINLFIDRDIYRTLWSWQIPTIMFTSLYPLAVIIVAPFMAIIWSYLANRNKEPTVSVKLGIGLLLAGIGFVCFMAAALSSEQTTMGYLPIMWILLGNLALGTGELCLMPAMFSAISRLAPEDLKSTMMGVWFLFIAFGGYLSSVAAKLSTHQSVAISPFLSDAIYSHAFVKVSIAAFLIAGLLFTLTPWIKSLMKA
jgi:POT family proton-dependent oligopeptide transporter